MTEGFRRENVIDKVLTYIVDNLAKKGMQDLVCAEVGTAFGEDQGSSTLRLVKAVQAVGQAARLWSIDNDQSHIDQARAILERKGIEDDERIIFHKDIGRNGLRQAVAATPHFDFVYLDGGANPEHNLDEFLIAHAHLREGGVILIDDAHSMAQTPAYPLPRPFGKATLVLPYLIIGEYINSGRQVLTDVVAGWRDSQTYPSINYRILQGRMVLCGPSDLLASFDRPGPE